MTKCEIQGFEDVYCKYCQKVVDKVEVKIWAGKRTFSHAKKTCCDQCKGRLLRGVNWSSVLQQKNKRISDIARELGVSRQRVHQIRKRHKELGLY